MDAIRNLQGLNLNILGLVGTVVTSAATTTTITAVATGGIATVARKGRKCTLAAGAKAYAQYDVNGVIDTTTKTLVATATVGQAAIVVHCLKNVGKTDTAAGTETLVQVIGPIVNTDASGNVVASGTSDGGLDFPNIADDDLVPIAYTVVSNPAGSSTATFTFGTSNWNATSIVTSNAYDIAALPRRSLATLTSIP